MSVSLPNTERHQEGPTASYVKASASAEAHNGGEACEKLWLLRTISQQRAQPPVLPAPLLPPPPPRPPFHNVISSHVSCLNKYLSDIDIVGTGSTYTGSPRERQDYLNKEKQLPLMC